MEIGGKFEKVSLDVFEQDLERCGSDSFDASEAYELAKMPDKSGKKKACYDFYAPTDIEIEPHQSVLIPTGYKVKLNAGFVMIVFPKKNLGHKYSLRLANTISVIDQSFYEDSEGGLIIKLVNSSSENKTVSIKAGEPFVQGLFVKYGETE